MLVIKRLVTENLETENLVKVDASYEDIEIKMKHFKCLKGNLQYLTPLKHVISKTMLHRLAEGVNGMRTALLGEITNGNTTIIKRELIIDKISEHFQANTKDNN